MPRPQKDEIGRGGDPQTNETYLCVVSEWQGGRNSGNCYPVFVLSQQKVLKDPETEFPNAGAIFMPSRTGKAYDFVLLRPLLNRTYANQSYRDCYFVPQASTVHAPERDELDGVYSILTVTRLDQETRQIPSPGQMVTPVFFVRDLSRAGKILGPLRRVEVRRQNLSEALESVHWHADSADGLAWSFPASALEANKLRLETYTHPRSDLNDILAKPYEFIVGKVNGRFEGGEPLDLAAPDDVVRFFLSTAGVSLPGDVVRALEAIPTRQGSDSPAYLRSRYDRLSRLLRTARELENERRRIAGDFLASDVGKSEIQAAIAKAKAEARAEAEENMEADRRRMEAELDELKAKRNALQADFQAERARLEKQEAGLRAVIASLEAGVDAESKKLQKRVLDELPGLLAFSSVAPAAGARSAGHASGNEAEAMRPRASLQITPREPARPPRRVEDESLFVEWIHGQLAAMGLHFSVEMVANIFTCLKCSSLTLIGGPPGVGKSSLVRALPVLLGQEHAYLELSVRRTWADDRAILGFPDVFHERYEPGTTGFVPHLVRAAKDHQAKAGGIYIVLFDEFNLAPPEYYFSEFLRILQMHPADRVLRLYTPTPGMENDPIPPEIPITPNVSFWGTVNLDETTEPLSPRLLDRAHFVIIGENDVMPRPAANTARHGHLGPYGFEELASARERDQAPNEKAAQLVEEAIAVLRDDKHAERGPPVTFHPRQLKEIERYLAAARSIPSVLPVTAAADLAINQRVLPALRGRGEAFRARIEAFHAQLEASSLQRSASRLERVLRHARENYDSFDFHVY